MRDLDDINRRMAQACGYEYSALSPDWSQWWCRSVPDGHGWYKAPGDQSWTCAACHGFPPAYATDWSLTGPLIDANVWHYNTSEGGNGYFDYEFVLDGETYQVTAQSLLPAFCLAYLARHEAQEQS